MTPNWINKIIDNLPFKKLSGAQVFNIVMDIIAAYCFIALIGHEDVSSNQIVLCFFGMGIMNYMCFKSFFTLIMWG